MKFASLYFLDHARDRPRRTAAAMSLSIGAGVDAQQGAARPVRGAVRLHLGREQQRLRVRRPHANTPWYNTTLALAMLFGRLLPIIIVLGLAGSLGRSDPCPRPPGPCAPTSRSSSGCWSA